MSKRRVVVTGIGMMTPLGLNVADTWSNLLQGISGVVRIEDFDVSEYSTKIWAPVKKFDATQYIDAKDARRMDVFTQFGVAASVEAMRDAGIVVTEENAARFGIHQESARSVG